MEPLRVKGFIDRIDRVDEQLVVVDYKSGTTRINRDEMESGRDFQMMIYTEALSQDLAAGGSPAQVAGGLFWHLRNLDASGVFKAEDEDDIAAVESAKAHIAQNLRQGRARAVPGARQQTRKWQMLALLRILSLLPSAGHRPPQDPAAS